MAMTESTMLELGTLAPDFNLVSTDNQQVNLASFDNAELLVVIFMCNHCPYVIHIADALAGLANTYKDKKVAFVAINSNDTQAYPADSFELMKEEKAKRAYNFPYLYDETQSVAKAYSAACTPDFFVFNKERKLAYRGQFDDTRPFRISSGNYDSAKTPANGETLNQVLLDLLEGNTLEGTQYPSLGCNIKWIPGNEPDHCK